MTVPVDQVANLWSRELSEKLRGPQLVKKLRAFVEPEVSLSCSRQPATCHILKPDESNPTDLFKIDFNIIIPSTARSSKWLYSLVFPYQTPTCTSSLSSTCHDSSKQISAVFQSLVGLGILMAGVFITANIYLSYNRPGQALRVPGG